MNQVELLDNTLEEKLVVPPQTIKMIYLLGQSREALKGRGLWTLIGEIDDTIKDFERFMNDLE